MRTFLLTLLRFIVAFAKSLRDPEFRAILFVVLSLLLSGTIFYSGVEGWSANDALYFSVTTLTTTGYGDLHPTSPLSKVFTIVYLILGIGVFVAFVSKLSAEVLQRQVRRRGKGTRSKK